jgi:hypothetical protein
MVEGLCNSVLDPMENPKGKKDLGPTYRGLPGKQRLWTGTDLHGHSECLRLNEDCVSAARLGYDGFI